MLKDLYSAFIFFILSLDFLKLFLLNFGLENAQNIELIYIFLKLNFFLLLNNRLLTMNFQLLELLAQLI